VEIRSVRARGKRFGVAITGRERAQVRVHESGGVGSSRRPPGMMVPAAMGSVDASMMIHAPGASRSVTDVSNLFMWSGFVVLVVIGAVAVVTLIRMLIGHVGVV